MTRVTNIAENQLMLPSGKVITFNDDQFEGIGKIRSWLKNGDGKNFFTLAGYAGTGKSTIVKKVLDKYRGGIVVSAPTHKAKKVIMKTTKRDGQTLHGLLGLRPDVDLDNFNPNQPQFNPIAIPRIGDYNWVLIDEASMINQDLYNLILEQVNETRTKVLFMGDPAQIPPVGEKESVVFYQEQNDKIFHQLTKIERQDDGNPLMLYYDALRNNLTDIDGGIKRISKFNERGEGILFTVRKREFRNAVLQQYSNDEFKKDTDFCKLIAWKNDTVKAANGVIRSELLEKTNDVIEIGDLLMGYRTISAEDFRYNIIENSADYRVVDKSKLRENIYGIMGYDVKLVETLDRGQYHYQDVFIIDANDHQNLHLYGQMHDFFKQMAFADKKQWKKYYEFRRLNILMKNITTYQNGRERPDGEKIAKDMDYGYALTAHKSQGSTYTHVFVMENDINSNWLVKERNQIKYVALTRPTTTATVLTTKIDE